MARTDTEARAIVLVHGIGGGARIWAGQAATLAAAGFRPVALDLPGYGGRPPVTALDFDGLAADVERQIGELALHQPVLVGHSMGGMVVQTLLRRQPLGYRAAVLCCTSPAFGNPGGDFQRKFVADRVGLLDAGNTMADLAPRLVDAMMAPNPPAPGRALAIAVMSAVPGDTYRAAVRCLVTFDERASLAQIQVPVLCLAGEKDPNASPQVMERMASRIAGARYVCLPGLGHLPNLEAPLVFDTAVIDFLHASRASVAT